MIYVLRVRFNQAYDPDHDQLDPQHFGFLDLYPQ